MCFHVKLNLSENESTLLTKGSISTSYRSKEALRGCVPTPKPPQDAFIEFLPQFVIFSLTPVPTNFSHHDQQQQQLPLKCCVCSSPGRAGAPYTETCSEAIFLKTLQLNKKEESSRSGSIPSWAMLVVKSSCKSARKILRTPATTWHTGPICSLNIDENNRKLQSCFDAAANESETWQRAPVFVLLYLFIIHW